MSKAADLARRFHRKANPLAMQPLRFDAKDEAILAVIDQLFAELASVRASMSRLDDE